MYSRYTAAPATKNSQLMPSSFSPRHFCLLLGLCLTLVMTGCSKEEQKPAKAPSATIISTTIAKTTSMEIREEAVGTIEGLVDPTIAAEVAARVVKVLVKP